MKTEQSAIKSKEIFDCFGKTQDLRLVQKDVRFFSRLASLFVFVGSDIDAVSGFRNVVKYLAKSFYGDSISDVSMVYTGMLLKEMTDEVKLHSSLFEKYQKVVEKLHKSKNFRPQCGYSFDLSKPIGCISNLKFRSLTMFETIDVLDDSQAYGMLRDGTNPMLKNKVFDKNLFGSVLQTTLDTSSGMDVEALFDIKNERDIGLCLSIAMSLVNTVFASFPNSNVSGFQELSKHAQNVMESLKNRTHDGFNDLTQLW